MISDIGTDPVRIPAFHTCVGVGEEAHTVKWYQDKGAFSDDLFHIVFPQFQSVGPFVYYSNLCCLASVFAYLRFCLQSPGFLVLKFSSSTYNNLLELSP